MLCCPQCGIVQPQYYRVKKRKCYACMDCGHHIYPLTGTIFGKTHVPLRLWFYAIYLFSTSKHGYAAKELQRQLGVTYKTAWRMCKQIRLLMRQEALLLRGEVEADEAYIGGRRRSSNRFSNKVPLLGVVERRGKVLVVVTDHASASTAMPFLRASVQAGSILHTDESSIYSRAHREFDHHKVSHSAHEYVRDDDYTNTIEGVWGLLKPGLTGTHRSVSKKYLQSYVNERVWHYNHRKELTSPLLLAAALKRLK